ncbi:MAG: exo-alpha-sialidase [Planctomycetaceae bacterium]|nr:exo-alpha-sialidase [Planctomycetaceae bacterium]
MSVQIKNPRHKNEIGFVLLILAILLNSVGYAADPNASWTAISIKLSDPVVVARAPVELNRAAKGWGRWQFPHLSQLTGNRLQVRYSLNPDSYESVGKSSGQAVSDDQGQTWQQLEPAPDSEVEEGILLPSGDRLKPVALPSVRGEELDLPESVCDFVCSYRFPRSLYRRSDLPANCQGWQFARLKKGEATWETEQATVNIPDEIFHLTDETRRGLTPSIGKTEKVTKGNLPLPYMWGHMRIAPDGSLWGVSYGWRLYDGVPRYAPLFLRSTDEGRTWELQGEIKFVSNPQIDPHAETRDGFTEPDYQFMPDGSIICIMRTSDGNGHGPTLLTRSTDEAKTWSAPVGYGKFGKTPQLLTLKNGVTLATYGQSGGPGYFMIRATDDPAGLNWTTSLKMKVSKPQPNAWDTCGHTEIVPLDDHSALMVYSDFNIPDENNIPRKTILVRKIQVEPSE